MRSSLLQFASFQLAVLLATVPVRLCLFLNSRIDVNQFVHSSYPRPPPLRNLLEGLNLPLFHPLTNTFPKDATSKHKCFAFFFGSRSVTPDECVRFANSDPDGNVLSLEMATGSDTDVEGCLSMCQVQGFTFAGVENGTKCCTCFTFVNVPQALLIIPHS
jgi:hypothetical protein